MVLLPSFVWIENFDFYQQQLEMVAAARAGTVNAHHDVFVPWDRIDRTRDLFSGTFRSAQLENAFIVQTFRNHKITMVWMFIVLFAVIAHLVFTAGAASGLLIEVVALCGEGVWIFILATVLAFSKQASVRCRIDELCYAIPGCLCVNLFAFTAYAQRAGCISSSVADGTGYSFCGYDFTTALASAFVAVGVITTRRVSYFCALAFGSLSLLLGFSILRPAVVPEVNLPTDLIVLDSIFNVCFLVPMLLIQDLRERMLREKFLDALDLHLSERATARSAAETRRVVRALLPTSVLRRVAAGKPVIDSAVASVLIADLVDFTAWCSTRHTSEVVKMLSTVVAKLDHGALRFGVQKVKTIGDAYWTVCNVPDSVQDHTIRTAKFGLYVHDVVAHETAKGIFGELRFRVGIHVGRVVGTVLGQRYSYEVYGLATQIAEELEASSKPGGINLSSEGMRYLLQQEQILQEKNAILDELRVDSEGSPRKEKKKSSSNTEVHLSILFATNPSPLNHKFPGIGPIEYWHLIAVADRRSGREEEEQHLDARTPPPPPSFEVLEDIEDFDGMESTSVMVSSNNGGEEYSTEAMASGGKSSNHKRKHGKKSSSINGAAGSVSEQSTSTHQALLGLSGSGSPSGSFFEDMTLIKQQIKEKGGTKQTNNPLARDKVEISPSVVESKLVQKGKQQENQNISGGEGQQEKEVAAANEYLDPPPAEGEAAGMNNDDENNNNNRLDNLERKPRLQGYVHPYEQAQFLLYRRDQTFHSVAITLGFLFGFFVFYLVVLMIEELHSIGNYIPVWLGHGLGAIAVLLALTVWCRLDPATLTGKEYHDLQMMILAVEVVSVLLAGLCTALFHRNQGLPSGVPDLTDKSTTPNYAMVTLTPFGLANALVLSNGGFPALQTQISLGINSLLTIIFTAWFFQPWLDTIVLFVFLSVLLPIGLRLREKTYQTNFELRVAAKLAEERHEDENKVLSAVLEVTMPPHIIPRLIRTFAKEREEEEEQDSDGKGNGKVRNGDGSSNNNTIEVSTHLPSCVVIFVTVDINRFLAEGGLLNDEEEYAESMKKYLSLVEGLLGSAAGDGLTLIKTIGSVMLIAGPLLGRNQTDGDRTSAPSFSSEHDDEGFSPVECTKRALFFIQRLTEKAREELGKELMLRVGLHIGPLNAAVIGRKQLIYDIFGTTVNIAARVMTTIEPTTTTSDNDNHDRSVAPSPLLVNGVPPGQQGGGGSGSFHQQEQSPKGSSSGHSLSSSSTGKFPTAAIPPTVGEEAEPVAFEQIATIQCSAELAQMLLTDERKRKEQQQQRLQGFSPQAAASSSLHTNTTSFGTSGSSANISSNSEQKKYVANDGDAKQSVEEGEAVERIFLGVSPDRWLELYATVSKSKTVYGKGVGTMRVNEIKFEALMKYDYMV